MTPMTRAVINTDIFKGQIITQAGQAGLTEYDAHTLIVAVALTLRLECHRHPLISDPLTRCVGALGAAAITC